MGYIKVQNTSDSVMDLEPEMGVDIDLIDLVAEYIGFTYEIVELEKERVLNLLFYEFIKQRNTCTDPELQAILTRYNP